MTNAQVVTECTNPGKPMLCPVCLHAALFTFTCLVLCDEGVVALSDITTCGHCDEDDEE